MSSLNKVLIIGRLGQDPELKFMPSGNAVVNISVATSFSWKDKTTGERKEKTEWHRLTAYGKTAEIIGQYLKKGNQAYFEGRLETRKWQDNSGVDRYTTEIIVSDMRMLGSRDDAINTQSAAQEQPKRDGLHGLHQTPPPVDPAAGVDDDIPF